MKNKVLMTISILVLSAIFSKTCFCFDKIQRTYTNSDGSYVVSEIYKHRTADGPTAFGYKAYDKDGNETARSGNEFSCIIQDKSGNVIQEYNHHDARVVYILNDSNQIVALKSRWDGPVIQTFKYTDTGKLLVYNTDGTFIGAYEDLLDYHTSNHPMLWGGWYDPSKQNTPFQYIDHGLNLIDEDGKYYERDQKGNIIAVYEEDGTISKYDKGGNLQRKIDASGNIVWARRIYTVDEAEKASKDRGNTFRIKYK